jgi:tetratricopeptide (TPR) repeat protein
LNIRRIRTVLPFKKRLIFSLLPVTLLVALLVLAEFALRWLVPSAEDHLTSRVSHDGVEWYQINRACLRRYFPARSPLIPELKPSLMKVRKERNLFRIICLGESSMFGTPYEMTATIPGIVRKQLRHLYPGREFEVINLGASAINSNVIVDLSRQIEACEPDLVLVYMGHNEFYGPDGIGASFIEKTIPFMTRVKYRMRDLRLVQVFQAWLRGSSPLIPPGGEPNLMRQVSQGSLVRIESPDAQRVFGVFERNLQELVKISKEKKIPLIVSDVGSNLLFAPFVCDSLAAASGKMLEDALATFSSGKWLEAQTALTQIENQDSSNASVLYWMGRTLLAQSKTEDAKRYLERARDADLLKFRAPRRINAIIRSVCRETGTALVSADSVLAAASRDGISGNDVFWEHLHPTAYGYYLVANLFVRKIVEMNLVPGPAALPGASFLPFDADSLSLCWLELAYADLSIQHLTGKWPFKDFRRDLVVLDAADTQLRGIVEDVYARTVNWDEGCLRSAAYLWKSGRIRDARTTYEALLEDYPYGFFTNYLLGSLLNTAGEKKPALEYYSRSIRSNPRYPKAQLDLGLIEVNAGNFDEAITHLNRVLELIGDRGDGAEKANAFYGLAAAYANKGDLSEALRWVDKALALHPGYPDALNLRNALMRRRN